MIEDVPRLIKVQLILEPSISTTTDLGVARVGVMVISTIESCWMDPIIAFLVEDHILDDKKEANRARRIAFRCWLSADKKLYQRFFGGQYLLCLHPGKINELLTKLHDGVCGSHVGGRSLAHRAMTQGFWWPQMQKDAAEYVCKCEQCQQNAPLIHQPARHLNPIRSP